MKNILPQSLHQECIKCAKILRSFAKVETGVAGKGLPTDQFIPADIISEAKGLAILTVVKAGFFWGGKAGSGLVIAKLPNGSWSAPSAIATAGVSFGGQIGANVTDFVIILNSDSAVKAFSQKGNVTLGGNLSVSAGPYGRTGEISGTAANAAAVYSYSKSKGLFAGVSIEGSVLMERVDANEKFYGKGITAKMLLVGQIPVPGAANDLHMALNQVAGSTNPAAPMNSNTAPLISDPFANDAITPGQLRPVPPPPQLNDKPLHTQWHASSMPSDQFAYLPPDKMSEPVTAIALFDFAGQKEGDLSFRIGDLITVLQRGDNVNQWWRGRFNNKEGVFPANYVELKRIAKNV